jgi:hypothetical protein
VQQVTVISDSGQKHLMKLQTLAMLAVASVVKMPAVCAVLLQELTTSATLTLAIKPYARIAVKCIRRCAQLSYSFILMNRCCFCYDGAIRRVTLVTVASIMHLTAVRKKS